MAAFLLFKAIVDSLSHMQSAPNSLVAYYRKIIPPFLCKYRILLFSRFNRTDRLVECRRWGWRGSDDNGGILRMKISMGIFLDSWGACGKYWHYLMENGTKYQRIKYGCLEMRDGKNPQSPLNRVKYFRTEGVPFNWKWTLIVLKKLVEFRVVRIYEQSVYL